MAFFNFWRRKKRPEAHCQEFTKNLTALERVNEVLDVIQSKARRLKRETDHERTLKRAMLGLDVNESTPPPPAEDSPEVQPPHLSPFRVNLISETDK